MLFNVGFLCFNVLYFIISRVIDSSVITKDFQSEINNFSSELSEKKLEALKIDSVSSLISKTWNFFENAAF